MDESAPLHWSQVLELERLALPPGFRGLSDLLPVGIFHTDREGRYIYANGSWGDIAGLGPAQARGEGWLEAVHPEDREAVAFEWRVTVATQQPFELDYRLLRPSGETVWVVSRAVVDTSPGSPGGWVGTITDITENKRAAAALAQSEARFERAVRGSDFGIWDWDIATDHVYYSERFRALLGYEGDPAAFERAFKFRAALHPEDRERVLAALQRTLDHGARFDEEYRLLRRQGSYRWFRGHGIASHANGRAVRFTGSLADIARRKAAELALVQANAELERRVEDRTRALQEANRELEAFSYTVAHDLRAPLRALEGFTGLLGEHDLTALAPAARELVDRIAGSARRMSKMVEDLLEFSRVARRGITLMPLDMSRLAAAVADELARAHGAPVAIEVGALPLASGDLSLVRQVWANLIGNAIKFSAKSQAPRIEIGGERRGAEAVYTVRDNGAGFDPAYAEKLFKVFQRLHPAREYPGTGIGLATVRRIVEAHGGRIIAEGRPGEGAAFTFTLPLAGEARAID